MVAYPWPQITQRLVLAELDAQVELSPWHADLQPQRFASPFWHFLDMITFPQLFLCPGNQPLSLFNKVLLQLS